MKNILYIYKGDIDKRYHNDIDNIKVYCLSIGKIEGSKIEFINNQKTLNQIATKNSDIYSEYVYSQNSEFLKNNLIYKKKLSLYFLTDFSCKRSEIFSTYANFCNAIFIRNYLHKNKIDKVIFDGCNEDTFQAIKSVIGRTDFEKRGVLNNKSANTANIVIKNLYFFSKLFAIKLFQIFFIKESTNRKNSNIKELFLTRYPLHLNDEFYEDKYGDLVGKDGIYFVNLMTDGLHQNLSFRQYIKAKKKLKSEKIRILDDYLSLKDILSLFFYSIIFIFKLKPLFLKKYSLLGINLTQSIINEYKFSLVRIPRLLVWKKPLKRFLGQTKVNSFYYYLHEYSYGRMINFFFKNYAPETKTIGFQHGPSSLRKMVYMAARNELNCTGDGLHTFPTPNMVLAEEAFSKNIYLSSGYENVHVMNKIYRLDYLQDIDRSKASKNTSLIAPGLHDGDFLMMTLHNKILKSKDHDFILKVHPRANNKYAEKYKHLINLNISNEAITETLSKVNKVYATYSSVAIEAHYLGIDVEVVEIPGKINESPLIDNSFKILNY